MAVSARAALAVSRGFARIFLGRRLEALPRFGILEVVGLTLIVGSDGVLRVDFLAADRICRFARLLLRGRRLRSRAAATMMSVAHAAAGHSPTPHHPDQADADHDP